MRPFSKGENMITIIGNSIVNGYPHRWSESFTGILRSEYGFDTVNKGVNGDTVSGVLERFEKDVVSKKPSSCIILSGTNDFIQGRTAGYVYGMLCEMKAKAEGIKVYFLTPVLTEPEMAAKLWVPADYKSVNKEMIILADILREEETAECIDIQTALLEFGKGKSPEEVYVDGIHPSKEAHRAIAEYIAGRIG